jgi:hypothetical protein
MSKNSANVRSSTNTQSHQFTMNTKKAVMWECPLCYRHFERTGQAHSCMEKTVDDFLRGKLPYTTDLFYEFVKEYRTLGEVSVHATRSMIILSGKLRMAYVIQFGKNFIDIVFPFRQAYTENLCFVKIKQVPGSGDYNHHFRMYFKEDINEEVKGYMKLALDACAR